MRLGLRQPLHKLDESAITSTSRKYIEALLLYLYVNVRKMFCVRKRQK